MAHRWTDEELEGVRIFAAGRDWDAFHERFPGISYDAWETKRRRIVRDAVDPDGDQVMAEEALLRESADYERMRAAARSLDVMPSLGPVVETDDVVNFKIAFFDYETTGLKANFGRTLCMSVADMYGNVVTLRGDDPKLSGRNRRDDAPLVAASRDLLEQYNVLCSWNGKRFDLRYLNGRLMLGGERPIRADLMHIDLLPISRHYLAWHSHRLDAVAKTLRLATQKTELDFDAIEAARDGEAWAMDNIVEHCEHDVLVLRQVFHRYRDLLKVVHR